MKIIKIPDFQYKKEDIEKVARCFIHGGVVVYPTDTVYGIGCLATKPEPIERIYTIKQRSGDKPLLVLVSDLDMAQDYFRISKEQRDHIQEHWPGAVSFLLSSRGNLVQHSPEGLVVRLPKNEFLIRMIKRVGAPITSTSLNISGQGVARDPDKADFIRDNSSIDMVVDAGPLSGQPSRIVDIRDMKNKKILR